MIVGKQERFAIEAEITQRVDSWVLGRFRFWICGKAIGDWNDYADLKGCAQWLRDFHEKPRDRYEPRLVNLDAASVFREVYDPVVGPGGVGDPEQQPIPHSYSRFHISHLGMSSFEKVDVLLLKDEHGAERCLWREAGSAEVFECYLWRNEMESIAAEFCHQFDALIET